MLVFSNSHGFRPAGVQNIVSTPPLITDYWPDVVFMVMSVSEMSFLEFVVAQEHSLALRYLALVPRWLEANNNNNILFRRCEMLLHFLKIYNLWLTLFWRSISLSNVRGFNISIDSICGTKNELTFVIMSIFRIPRREVLISCRDHYA